jgi:hypothetical protein
MRSRHRAVPHDASINQRLLDSRSRRVAMRGDDLVGGPSRHFGHVVELTGEAAGTGGG